MHAAAVGTAPASYPSSKMAQGKLMEWVAKESAEEIRCYSVQPGIVETETFLRGLQMSKYPAAAQASLTWDDGMFHCVLTIVSMSVRDLLIMLVVYFPAHFFVWLASGEGRTIPSGKYLWANWDVNELKNKSKQLHENPMALTLTLDGWPFA